MGRLLIFCIVLLNVYSVTTITDVHRYKMPLFDSSKASMETVVRETPVNISFSLGHSSDFQGFPELRDKFTLNIAQRNISLAVISSMVLDEVKNKWSDLQPIQRCIGNTYERTHFMWDDVWLQKSEHHVEVIYKSALNVINVPANEQNLPYSLLKIEYLDHSGNGID